MPPLPAFVHLPVNLGTAPAQKEPGLFLLFIPGKAASWPVALGVADPGHCQLRGECLSRAPPAIIKCPSLHHMPLQGSMKGLHGGPLSGCMEEAQVRECLLFLFLFNVSEFRQKTPS